VLSECNSACVGEHATYIHPVGLAGVEAQISAADVATTRRLRSGYSIGRARSTRTTNSTSSDN